MLSTELPFKDFGVKISREELSWLQKIDVRRWSLDPELPHRTLQGAISRIPVSVICFTSLLSERAQRSNKQNSMRAKPFKTSHIFQSDLFKECIFNERYLVSSLIDWIILEISRLKLPKGCSLSKSNALALIKLERELIQTSQLRSKIPSHSDELFEAEHQKFAESIGDTVPLISTIDHPLERAEKVLSLPKELTLIKSSLGVTECFQHLQSMATTLTQERGFIGLLQAQVKLSELPISLKSPKQFS